MPRDPKDAAAEVLVMALALIRKMAKLPCAHRSLVGWSVAVGFKGRGTWATSLSDARHFDFTKESGVVSSKVGFFLRSMRPSSGMIGAVRVQLRLNEGIALGSISLSMAVLSSFVWSGQECLSAVVD